MNSFAFQKDLNPNILPEKSISKTPLSAVNPFYEFVTNMKPSNSANSVQTPNQKQTSVSVPVNSIAAPERKNSSDLNDPRRLLPIIRPPQTQNNANAKKNEAPETSQQNVDRQKRSRSREKHAPQNRQKSQSQPSKQKSKQMFRKTKLCPQYEKGECHRGSENCCFAHGCQQLRYYKTQICYAFEKGECKKPTEQCKYAHGKKQLRPEHELDKKHSQNRDSKKFQSDKFKNHNKDRGSESTHRQDYKDRRHTSRVDSPPRNSKHQKSQVPTDPLSYKKNLPLNKEYEKFLYGDSIHKGSPVQSNAFSTNKDSAYIIQNGPVNPVKTPYSMDAYSINLGQSFEPYPRSSVPMGYSEHQRPYKDLLKQKDVPREPAFYEKPREFNQMTYPHLNQVKNFPDKTFYPENSHPEIMIHGQNPDWVNPYRNPSSDFGQDFSQNPYKNSNQGGFNGQPFIHGQNGQNKTENFVDSGYRRPSGYSQGGNQVGRPEDFYRNEQFYGVDNRKSDFDGVRGVNQGFSGYRNDFPADGYNRYPPKDGHLGHVGKGAPMFPPQGQSYKQKGTYEGFSGKGYK